MSILAKKMSAISAVPESYASLGRQLGVVHAALLAAVQPFSEIPLRESGANVEAGVYKLLFEKADTNAPCFVLGGVEQPNLAIVQISKPLAEMASRKKLGAKAGADVPALGLLDLILMQSTANDILAALKDVLGEGSASLNYTGRYLSIEDVSGIDESDKWLQVTFLLDAKEDGANAEDGLSLVFMLSALMADTVVKALQSGNGGLVLDPANPWSAHMHNTVLQSSLPLKVIVEVLNMSVADCTRLELGQTISLPGASHKHLSVSTETGSGLMSLASSTLGVSKSNKAVKLLEDVDPEFLSDIGELMLS